MVRRVVPLLALAGCLAALGCTRDKGAVLVRWRVIDSATGSDPGRCSLPGGDEDSAGACCLISEGLVTRHVVIDHIRLRVQRLADVDLVTVPEVPCPSCCFRCRAGESVTLFELPKGQYKLWIEPLRCGLPTGVTPPAVVRTVNAGEVTNLNSVEIRIDSDTAALPSCPWGGPSQECTTPAGFFYDLAFPAPDAADAAADLAGSDGGG